MTQQTQTYAGMHAEHRQWASEHAMWGDDIANWRKQFESTLAQVSQLEALIRRHGESLDAHSQAIERIQHSSKNHEISMAAYLRDGADAEGQDAMVDNHRQKAERHAQQRDLHEQLKKRHHMLTAQLTMLQAVIEAT